MHAYYFFYPRLKFHDILGSLTTIPQNGYFISIALFLYWTLTPTAGQTLKQTLATLVLCLISSLLVAQDWLNEYNQSVDFYQSYQLKESRAHGETALSLFTSEFPEPHKNTASILRQLSLVCFDQGDDNAAVDYAQREVEMLQQLGSDQDLSYSDALFNLGTIFSSSGRYLDAEPVISAALGVSSQYYDDQSPELAIGKGLYASVLFNLKKDEDAEVLFSESIPVLQQLEEIPFDYYNIMYNYASFKSTKGDFRSALSGFQDLEDLYSYDAPNFDYGAILIKVGEALDNLGQYNDAIKKYETAIETLEALSEQESDEYTIAQNNLSIDLQKTGQFNAAMDKVRDVLEKRKQSLDTNPEPYVITATNYANLLLRNGETSESFDFLNEVVEIYKTQSLPADLTLINALESKSKIELEMRSFSESVSTIDRALEICEEERIDAKRYSLLNQKAKVLSSQGKFTEAKQNIDEALDVVIDSYGGDSEQTAFVRITLAGIYTELGSYSIAEQQYLSALPVFERTYGRNHPEYATVIANYSSLLQLTGNYYGAELYLEDAVAIKKSIFGDQNLDYLTTYENLALLYIATARYTDALKILDDVLLTKEALLGSDDPSLAYTIANLANAKKQVAEYAEAEALFKRASTIYENSLGRNHLLYASTINNMALLYQKMGNIRASRPLFEEALKVYESELGRLSPDYATALENLATLYQMEKNTNKAKELLEEVLTIDEELLGKEHPLYSKTLHNLASIYEDGEEYEKARELFLESLEIDEKVYGTNHPSYASTLYNLAVLEQALENFETAKLYYDQVANIRLTILGENHPDYVQSVYGLASIAQITGDYETAKINYEIVINKYMENIQKYFPALSETEKSAFYGKIRPVFEAFMDFAVDYILLNHGSAEDRDSMLRQLYDLQLATKALLLNATNKVRNRILNSGDAELIALFNEWIALKENIVKSLALSKEEIEENNIDIPSMEVQSNEMEKQLSLLSTAFAQEFEKDVVSWEDVKNELGEREAALEIIRIKKNLKNDSILYAVLIVESFSPSPRMVVIANGDELEDRGFKIYKNSIVYKLEDKKSFDLFWKEIDKEITSTTNNIYLSADGVYNKVNISTLLDTEKEEYVVEKYNIRLLSNTRELVEQKSQTSEQNMAYIFGFPKYNLDKIEMDVLAAVVDEEGMRYSFGENVAELPGTLEEINNISKVMDERGWQYNTYTRVDASEDQIKALSSPKIFHVATHGFFLQDIQVDDDDEGIASRSQKFNPLMRSGLLFAGAENTIRNESLPGEEDGILTAYEAMNLSLDNTDLVVMSACETGLGEVKNGEGVYGLQRAFIVAGAKNLIMSLWKVNDATTQLLMSTFYNEWFSGKTRTEAFNQAIQTVKNDFPNPYFWGAFVMLGK